MGDRILDGTQPLALTAERRAARCCGISEGRRREVGRRHASTLMDRGLPHLRSGKCPLCAPHNLKHNHVLHERNLLLNVSVATTPRVPEEERLSIEYLSDDFIRLFVRYGYMEEPNVPRALRLARKLGLKLDIMAASFS